MKAMSERAERWGLVNGIVFIVSSVGLRLPEPRIPDDLMAIGFMIIGMVCLVYWAQRGKK